MSEQTNTKLIAEARAYAEAGSAYTANVVAGWPVRLARVTDALEAADARNAVLTDSAVFRESMANAWKAKALAALAVIERVAAARRENALDGSTFYGTALVDAALDSAPAEALAEHDQAIAEKAWDAGYCSDREALVKWHEPSMRELMYWPDITNPYRANPEPDEDANG